MTPLGHIGVSLLVAHGITKIFPSVDRNTILSAISIGGLAPDLDLLYRLYQKKGKVFDKTIGNHRFFPTHTPVFTLTISIPLILINFTFGIFFFVGTLVHFLIDTLFFPEGINLFYPMNRKMNTFLTIKTHKFWAPKPISQVDDWWKNYFSSPIFWTVEVLPFLISAVLLFRIL